MFKTKLFADFFLGCCQSGEMHSAIPEESSAPAPEHEVGGLHHVVVVGLGQRDPQRQQRRRVDELHPVVHHVLPPRRWQAREGEQVACQGTQAAALRERLGSQAD